MSTNEVFFPTNISLAVFQEFLRNNFKVHGNGTPAGQAQLQANDAILKVDGKDVTDMKHNEVVQLIKGHSGLTMSMTVERLVHLFMGKDLSCIFHRYFSFFQGRSCHSFHFRSVSQP